MPLKLLLIGHGKMGKMVEEIALNKGHEICAIFKRDWPKNADDLICLSDICIDFTHPDSVLQNVKRVAKAGGNLVVGTTGWYDHFDAVKNIVGSSDVGLLYGPNFSIGVAMFMKIVERAGALMAPHLQYDVGGFEIHHNQKVDSPSGTAKALSKTLHAQGYAQGHAQGAPVEFSAVRVGSFPGTHTVMFDSPFDTIALTHTTRNRTGFASGAISAAEWLHGKKGVFTFEDMLK